MNYKKLLLVVVILALGGLYYVFTLGDTQSVESPSFTDTEVGFEAEPDVSGPEDYTIGGGAQYTLEELRAWQRPEGPQRVGIQVGHLDNDQVPEELSGLTNNGAGATGGGYTERDTVAVIAGLVAAQLESAGIVVDLLPTTIPKGYVADAFVSIHADGNTNNAVRGFKMAGPRRDYSGLSEDLVAALYLSYGETTSLPIDPSISRRMTAYYAFNWPRYEYAVHPYTPSVIVETGFMTNAVDRLLLVNNPELPATGIANGILAFLESEREPKISPVELIAPTFPIEGTIECAPVREERRNRDERPCEASIVTASGTHYMLVQTPPLATSSLPYAATVTGGEYMPIQILDNYFWFHFEAAGMIQDPEIERL